MTVFSEAYRAARKERSERAKRVGTPILVFLGRFIGTYLPSWKRARTAVMQWGAFATLTTAAFQWHFIAGLVASGVSLLILEALGGERA